MAFATTTEWDVRTTGNDANGGGFDTASTGTDRSQQDTAFIAFTDLVIGGTNTTVTSAAHPFDATSVGNIINITGGTGFTVQRVQIVSVAGAVATCDKAVGTASSTGGTGNLGGSLLTLATPAGLIVNGNTVHVKAGTYTLTASVTIVGPNLDSSWIGYSTTHNDNGTKPLVTTSTNSTNLFNFTTGSGGVTLWNNLLFTNTATTRAACFPSNGTYPGIAVYNCILDGFTYGIGGGGFPFYNVSAFASEFKNFSTAGAQCGFRGAITGCWFHGVTGTGLGIDSSGNTSVDHCIFSNLYQGFACVSGTSNLVTNCTFYKCSNTGISSGTEVSVNNNIFYQNGFGTSGGSVGIQAYNAFGAQTTSNRGAGAVRYVEHDIILTADPFTSALTNDFSLNNVAGGGVLCKGKGYPGIFPGGTSTGSLDIGAVQGASGGGASGSQIGIG